MGKFKNRIIEKHQKLTNLNKNGKQQIQQILFKKTCK